MAASLIISAQPFNAVRSAWSAYERSLRKQPVLTQAVSSALLWGLGDGMAQRIENGGRSGTDCRRLAMTAAFGGAVIGPVGHCWYELLERLVVRMGLACSVKSMLLKVAVDNLLFSPAYVLAFFAYGCLAIDGLSPEAFGAKLRSEFVPTMLAEAVVWPPYMAAVFSRVPVQHQLLAVNVATLFDVCFLSWARTRHAVGQQQQQPAEEKPAERERQRGKQERRRGKQERQAGVADEVGGNGGTGGEWRMGHDWLTYGVPTPQQQAAQQPPPRSAGEARRRELAACLWDASAEPSLGRRALMAASATSWCSSAGSGSSIFW